MKIKKAVNWVALGVALATGCSVACGAAQSKSAAQNAAIVAGCKVSLDLTQGEAGERAEVAQGCEAALRAWERK